MNLQTHRRSRIATPALSPYNVTIVGDRVVWAENQYKKVDIEFRAVRGYVRMIRL
jgi:hypothetical protein